MCVALTMPTVILFQGTFSDQDGYLNATRNLTISIRSQVDLQNDIEGTSLWQETFNDQVFKDGFIEVDLGTLSPLDLSIFQQDNLSYVIQIQGVEGLTNIPIRAVPFTISAHTAQTISDIDTAVISGNL